MPDLVQDLSPSLQQCSGAGTMLCYWWGAADRQALQMSTEACLQLTPPHGKTMGQTYFSASSLSTYPPTLKKWIFKQIYSHAVLLVVVLAEMKWNMQCRLKRLVVPAPACCQRKAEVLWPSQGHFKQKLDDLWAKLPWGAWFGSMALQDGLPGTFSSVTSNSILFPGVCGRSALWYDV